MHRRPFPGERSNSSRISGKRYWYAGSDHAPPSAMRVEPSLAFADHSRTLPAMSITPYALIDPDAPARRGPAPSWLVADSTRPGRSWISLAVSARYQWYMVGSSFPAYAA